MADIEDQNFLLFWGTVSSIGVYTVIIMFVNVYLYSTNTLRDSDLHDLPSKPFGRMGIHVSKPRVQQPDRQLLLNGKHQHSH